MRRLTATHLALLALVSVAIGAGCGEGGAANGATVRVYVAAGLCGPAERQLARDGGRAGDLKVQVICLARAASADGRVSLAAAGVDARQATEDSTAVAYLESPGPAAKFTQAIVEAADIAWLQTSSPSMAMHRVLGALEDTGSSSPRAAVLDEVG